MAEARQPHTPNRMAGSPGWVQVESGSRGRPSQFESGSYRGPPTVERGRMGTQKSLRAMVVERNTMMRREGVPRRSQFESGYDDGQSDAGRSRYSQRRSYRASSQVGSQVGAGSVRGSYRARGTSERLDRVERRRSLRSGYGPGVQSAYADVHYPDDGYAGYPPDYGPEGHYPEDEPSDEDAELGGQPEGLLAGLSNMLFGKGSDTGRRDPYDPYQHSPGGYDPEEDELG